MENNMKDNNGFNKLFWGFLFIMISFRIQGFDIFPDIIGYLFFYAGFNMLAANSEYFVKARNYNIPMIIVSIFTIYQKPTTGIYFGFGILIGIASLVFNLLVIYNLFMGIKDMAENQGHMEISFDAQKYWNQYFLLQLAVFLLFIFMFIPILGLIFILIIFIASIVMAIKIISFMKKCEEDLQIL